MSLYYGTNQVRNVNVLGTPSVSGSELDFSTTYQKFTDATQNCYITFSDTDKRCESIVEYTDSTSASAGTLTLYITSANWYENYIHIINQTSNTLTVIINYLEDPNGYYDVDLAIIIPNSIEISAGKTCEIGVMMNDLSGITVDSTSELYNKMSIVAITDRTDLDI